MPKQLPTRYCPAASDFTSTWTRRSCRTAAWLAAVPDICTLRETALELAFKSRKLRDLCEREHIAIQTLGMEVAATLKRRLADLQAASCALELPVARPRSLEESSIRTMAIPLAHDCQLVFSSNHVSDSRMTTGDLYWQRVTRILILSIGPKDA